MYFIIYLLMPLRNMVSVNLKFFSFSATNAHAIQKRLHSTPILLTCINENTSPGVCTRSAYDKLYEIKVGI